MSKQDAPTISVSLTVKDAAAALDFYAKAFGAEELFRMPAPDGSVAHAEFRIGSSRLYISGESPDWKAFAMPERTLASSLLSILVPDCDAAYAQALAAGALSIAEPTDQFWGVRTAVLADPYGYRWSFGQVVEDLSPEEVAERARKIFASGS